MDSKNRILITGAAGYIGRICQYHLENQGYFTVGLDNLSAGTKPIPNLEFYELALHQKKEIHQLCEKYQFDAIVHLAANINVAHSTIDPQGYHYNNVIGSQSLIEASQPFCHNFVFASSAAVYGEQNPSLISERHPIQPASPYGQGKFAVEEILHNQQNLSSISLRLFNVAGAYLLHNGESLGEDHLPETHLIPSVIQKILQGEPIHIYGKQYDTVDGTCVRDYIHVLDVVQAIQCSIESLLESSKSRKPKSSQHRIYNVGSGEGHSVLQTVNYLRNALSDYPSNIIWQPPRNGDPTSLIAQNQKLQNELPWRPLFAFQEILEHSIQHQLKKHRSHFFPSTLSESS